jgi:hypothetical protein
MLLHGFNQVASCCQWLQVVSCKRQAVGGGGVKQTEGDQHILLLLQLTEAHVLCCLVMIVSFVTVKRSLCRLNVIVALLS